MVFEMFPTKALCMVWWCCCLLCFRHTFYCIACLVVAAQNLHMPIVKCSVGGYAHFVPCTGAPAIDHDQLHFHSSWTANLPSLSDWHVACTLPVMHRHVWLAAFSFTPSKYVYRDTFVYFILPISQICIRTCDCGLVALWCCRMVVFHLVWSWLAECLWSCRIVVL